MTFPVTINSNTYQEADFINYGHLTNFPNIVADVATVAAQVASDKTDAEAAQTAAEVAQAAAETAETNAETAETNAEAAQTAAEAARDLALAAVTSAQVPFTTSAGTSTVYTATIADYTVGDGSIIRLSMHTAGGDNPTLAVNGGTAYNIVTPSGDNLLTGDFATGQNLLLMYDTYVNKWVVLGGMELNKLYQSLDANGQTIDDARLTNTPVTYATPCPIFGTLAVDTDYVVGFYDYEVTLEGGNFDPDEGSGTVAFYLSANKTSASGTLITGGTFNALDASTNTPDSNDFTANNTVAGSGASARYLIARPTSVTGLVNLKGTIFETKNSEDK